MKYNLMHATSQTANEATADISTVKREVGTKLHGGKHLHGRENVSTLHSVAFSDQEGAVFAVLDQKLLCLHSANVSVEPLVGGAGHPNLVPRKAHLPPSLRFCWTSKLSSQLSDN